jgi:DMSO/TMAO reductase YedYZ molybdopterin-dependent catalytic subunit
MMRRRLIATVLAFLGAAALAGCSALDPYPTYPQAATAGPAPGRAPAPRIAICYNALSTSLAQVRAEAQQECATDYPRTRPEPAATDYYLQNCPLLLPARATFACIPER